MWGSDGAQAPLPPALAPSVYGGGGFRLKIQALRLKQKGKITFADQLAAKLQWEPTLRVTLGWLLSGAGRGRRRGRARASPCGVGPCYLQDQVPGAGSFVQELSSHPRWRGGPRRSRRALIISECVQLRRPRSGESLGAQTHALEPAKSRLIPTARGSKHPKQLDKPDAPE